MKTKPAPGTTVRFTAEFLKNTGLVVGGEGFSRWTVEACDCKLCAQGLFVAVNEPSLFVDHDWRHMYFSNLESL